MAQNEQKPICISSEDLIENYLSNNKELSKEDVQLRYDEEGISFFQKIIQEFVNSSFENTTCLIALDAFKIIKEYKSNKGYVYWLANEYLVDFSLLKNKNKKNSKVLIVPFSNGNDLDQFASSLLEIMNIHLFKWNAIKLKREGKN